MRRHLLAARLGLSWTAAAALAVVASVVPRLSGAPHPTLPDTLVAVGLCAAAAAATATSRPVIHHATSAAAAPWSLWLAATSWTLTGVATSLPAHVESPVARLVLLPHAALVLAVAVTLTQRRGQLLPASVSGAAVVAAGAGWQAPVLAMLGFALLAAAALRRRSTRPTHALTAVTLGVALLAVDPRVLGGGLRPAMLTVAVEMLLLALAGAAAWQARGHGPLGVAPGADRTSPEDLKRWLAGVLGVPELTVVFPGPHGTVDVSGLPADLRHGSTRLHSQGGVVAYLYPAVAPDPLLREPLVMVLSRVGDIARLRAQSRQAAGDVAASRGRLQAAADRESSDLEHRLRSTVLARLDRIHELLLADGSSLTERVAEVKAELLRHARGLDPLAGRSLTNALADHRTRGVRVDLHGLRDLESADSLVGSWAARTAWYVANEGITNAVKHAPGAAITLRAWVTSTGEGCALHVVVEDDGGGTADPRGSGLQGLADRVAAAGGQLTVATGSEGTTLTATIPGQASTDVPPTDRAFSPAGWAE